MIQHWRGVALLLIGWLAAGCGSSMGAVDAPRRTDGTPIPLGPDSLVGKPLAEISQYAVANVQSTCVVRSGVPEVRLVRRITPSERANLGFGCPGEQMTIEQPPRVAVILQGDFGGCRLPGSRVINNLPARFVGIIFEEWRGQAETHVVSYEGGSFRRALNDPSLPHDESSKQPQCPTPPPRTPTMHYGDTAPGIVIPIVPTPPALTAPPEPPPMGTSVPPTLSR